MKALEVLLASALLATHGAGQNPTRVDRYQKISENEGDFSGFLNNYDYFGDTVTHIGDIDNDGVPDLAVGAPGDDDGGSGTGALWLLRLNPGGTVKASTKISGTSPEILGLLSPADFFGSSVVSLDDLDGDSVSDLLVGASGDSDSGPLDHRGACWVLFLNADGSVKGHQKISTTQGGFAGQPENGAGFGYSVEVLGDLDGDGVTDVAVGAPYDDRPGKGDSIGTVWILFLNADGTVKQHQKIGNGFGGFPAILQPFDYFGHGLGGLGDLDGDGVPDLLVGSPGRFPLGAIWVLFLNADGTVKTQTQITGLQGSAPTGTDLERIEDLDGDGIGELLAGQYPGIWILSISSAGVLRWSRRIGPDQGGFTGDLDPFDGDFFGRSVTRIGDLDGDGFSDLAVGTSWDDDGGPSRGAVWVLFLGGFGQHAAPAPPPPGPPTPWLPVQGLFGALKDRVRTLVEWNAHRRQAARPGWGPR